MPVIIPQKHYQNWLENYEERKELMANLPEVKLKLYPVSDLFNSARNDVPKCVTPIA